MPLFYYWVHLIIKIVNMEGLDVVVWKGKNVQHWGTGHLDYSTGTECAGSAQLRQERFVVVLHILSIWWKILLDLFYCNGLAIEYTKVGNMCICQKTLKISIENNLLFWHFSDLDSFIMFLHVEIDQVVYAIIHTKFMCAHIVPTFFLSKLQCLALPKHSTLFYSVKKASIFL